MASLMVRWWSLASVTLIVFIYSMVVGLGSSISQADSTGISWVIFGILFAATLHLGYILRTWGKEANLGVTKWASEVCTSLGLMGTIIGLILMLLGTFSGLDVSDPESLKSALTSMSGGIGTALVTTLVGLICSLNLQAHVALIEQKWRG